MIVAFSCPRCEKTAHAPAPVDAEAVVCPHCDLEITVPAGAIDDGRLKRCLVCPSTDLFIRKDFPQRLGVAIVAAGVVASSITWWQHRIYATYGILFATALVDLVLYLFWGNALNCYRCGAIYRDVEHLEEHAEFNLEVHEKHRQQMARGD